VYVIVVYDCLLQLFGISNEYEPIALLIMSIEDVKLICRLCVHS